MRQSQITSAMDEGMEMRESNTPINLTKDHVMLVFNEASIHFLDFFLLLSPELLLSFQNMVNVLEALTWAAAGITITAWFS